MKHILKDTLNKDTSFISETLPGENKIIPAMRDGSTDRIIPEYYYFFSVTNQNFKDPLVMSKARSTTVHIKRWNANEDFLLQNLVHKYAGNWKKM